MLARFMIARMINHHIMTPPSNQLRSPIDFPPLMRDAHPDFIARDLRNIIASRADSRLLDCARFILLQLETIIDELNL